MTSAYILILAILLLGGGLAVVGDRIGTKVGKARLRLFNLRPKHTAALVAIITGTLISGSTLGLLFALSEALRDGVFRLDEIQRQLRLAEAEFNNIATEKERVDEELNQVARDKRKAERAFAQAQERNTKMREQATRLTQEVKALRSQRERLLRQIPRLQQQVRDRDLRLSATNRELSRIEGQLGQKDQSLRQRALQVVQRDERINALDTTIAERDRILQSRDQDLKTLNRQLEFLNEEVATLEQYYQNYQVLRQGNVALVRGELLSFGVVRIVDPKAAPAAIDQLLRNANQQAILSTRPFYNGNFSERVVQITQAQVEQAIRQLQGGEDYVLRILSAGNYVENEETVRVFADIARNEQVFSREEFIAAISIEAGAQSQADIRERLDTLLAAAQFRARRSGILGEIIIGDGQVQTVMDFLTALTDSSHPVDQIQAIAADDTYTAGPLRIKLIASYQGTVLFSS